jgi:hypothetical protein
MHVIT